MLYFSGLISDHVVRGSITALYMYILIPFNLYIVYKQQCFLTKKRNVSKQFKFKFKKY